MAPSHDRRALDRGAGRGGHGAVPGRGRTLRGLRLARPRRARARGSRCPARGHRGRKRRRRADHAARRRRRGGGDGDDRRDPRRHGGGRRSLRHGRSGRGRRLRRARQRPRAR
ncbi:PE family protein, partial [Aeromicrobium phragmitis]